MTDWETSVTPGNRRSRAAASSVAAPSSIFTRHWRVATKSILKWIFMYFFIFAEAVSCSTTGQRHNQDKDSCCKGGGAAGATLPLMIEGGGASSEQETPLSLLFKRAEDKKEQHSSTCLDQEHGVQQWLALGGRVVRDMWFASRERPHHPRSSLGRDGGLQNPFFSLSMVTFVWSLTIGCYLTACTPKQLLMTNQPWVSVLPPLLFCEMTQLRSLTITQTSLTSFPPSISQLTALRILQLSSNKLTALPNFIGSHYLFLHLRVPNPDSCETGFRVITGRLSSLEQLYCNNNHLASLPCAVSRLTSLQILFLDDNQLTSLPFELASMPCTRGPLSFSVACNRFFCSQV